MSRVKKKKIDKSALFKNGYKRVYGDGDYNTDYMKKVFPLKIKKKNIYLNGIITVCIEDCSYRMDVVMYDGYPYAPFYVNDDIHKNFVREIKNKMNYELNKVVHVGRN